MIYKSSMVDLFGKHSDDAIYEYIKVGRKFWSYTDRWHLLTITYKRSGCIFYTEDDSSEERYFGIGSIMFLMLVPETIYLSELPYKIDIKSNSFDDYDGSISINIIE